MEYFLGEDEIDQITESNLNDIKCVAQFSLTEDDMLSFLWGGKVKVKDNAILIKHLDERILHKLIYHGRNTFLHHSEEFNETICDRMKTEVVDSRFTVISIRTEKECENTIQESNMKFNNGEEFMRFDYNFYSLLHCYTENYIAIYTGRGGGSSHGSEAEEMEASVTNKRYFVLIKMKEKILMEIFRLNLAEYFPKLHVKEMRFNKYSSNLLFIMKNNSSVKILITFNVTTLKFSLPFQIKDDFVEDFVFYTFHNTLKDLILLINHKTSMLYIIKESLKDNALYIYQKTSLKKHVQNIFTAYCCSNRTNEILLYIYGQTDKIKNIFVYNVLNGIKNNCLFDRPRDDEYRIFFNQSGEEIFVITDNNQLNVFVYRSKVNTLKSLCQLVVSQQFSNKQLVQMNLPRNILKHDLS